MNIDKLVDRFLAWPLPKSVASDGCVTNRDYPHQRIGTNLLTADEAKQMIEYLLSETAASTTLPQEPAQPPASEAEFATDGERRTAMPANLLESAKALRAAQRDYMANRGNDAIGKVVAEKAAALDAAIESAASATQAISATPPTAKLDRYTLLTPKQRSWCRRYEQQTTFEPLMDDFLAGNESFLEAARNSVWWFTEWSNEAHCKIRNIPGDDV